ncbi:transposase [Kitasatospora sp. NPDC058406]|uniref:IS110 family transposase n=1 Tax=Kitasatospora sp. NPDC058406 TaxID=3346483 RepID=UPI003658D37C
MTSPARRRPPVPRRSGDGRPCSASRITQPAARSPQPAAQRHTRADPGEEILLAVDTHKDFHAAAVVTVLGAALDGRTFPATTEGYRQLVAWARSFGTLRRAGVECTGSYGAALARLLRDEGIEVTEVNQPDKAARRRRSGGPRSAVRSPHRNREDERRSG